MRALLAVLAASGTFALAALPAEAITYESVTLNVPVSIDKMPIGTTAKVVCGVPTFKSADTPIPVQTVGGFVVYHGPPIVVTIKNTGNAQWGLVTGAHIGCSISWSPSSSTDPAQSKYETASVLLK